jgi:hypothetical protein
MNRPAMKPSNSVKSGLALRVFQLDAFAIVANERVRAAIRIGHHLRHHDAAGLLTQLANEDRHVDDAAGEVSHTRARGHRTDQRDGILA